MSVPKFQLLSVVGCVFTILALPASLPVMAQQSESGTGLVPTSATFAPPGTGALSPSQGTRANSAERASADSHRRADLDNVSFLSPLFYASGAENSNAFAIADVNGDGKLDLVVSNCDPIGSGGCGFFRDGVVGVLLGIGDGGFEPVMAYDSGGNLASSVAVADVNGDGIPDIIVTHVCSEVDCEKEAGVSILLGNGDGTFRAAVTYNSGGQESFSVAVADVNGDGKQDLLITNTCPNEGCTTDGVVSVLLGNGDGTFQPPVNYDSGGIGPRSLTAVDLRGDGKIDVLVANSGDIDGNFYSSGSLDVLLGKGDGTFQSPVTYSVGPNPWSLAVADVNGDGKLDALVADACWCGHDADLAVLLGNGDGTFQPAVTYDSGNIDTFSIAVADVNGDGNADLLAGSLGTNALSILLGNGNGTFQPAVTFDTGASGIYSVATADVNGDGKPDVVSTDGDYVSIMLNNTGVSQAPTTISLLSSLNPSSYGQSVTFTATVTAASGTPTGAVTFYAGTTTLGSATLASGTASISTTSLAAGSRSITAAYDGSSNFAPSPSPVVNQVVNGTTTTATSLRSSLNPSTAGESVTFTATVTSASGAPTGTVIFYDGAIAEIGDAALTGGIASLSSPSLSPGAHSITAAYQGSGSIGASTSPALTQRVKSDGPFPSKTTVTTSGSPSFVGQSVTFAATVTSTHGAIPNGEVVTFRDHNGVLGTGTTADGVATFTTSTLTAQTYAVEVTYPGDGTFRPSSGVVTQVVERYSTATAVSSSLNPSAYGQTVTFTATVSSTGPNVPTGKVTFKNGTTGIGSATLSGGVATISKSNLAVGTHSITASYDGDSESGESTSPVLDQVVQ
jgi:hypothetical protein